MSNSQRKKPRKRKRPKKPIPGTPEGKAWHKQASGAGFHEDKRRDRKRKRLRVRKEEKDANID